jgi:hypothetical protein
MNWLLAVATLVCAAGTGLCYYFMELSPRSPQKRLSEGKEFRMPDVRFRYTPQELYGIYTDAGRRPPADEALLADRFRADRKLSGRDDRHRAQRGGT